jgi:hypothetical protein
VRNPIQDYYAILGVHPNAEDIVIRAAYKALAQRYHPDRFAGSKEEAHRRMSDLTKAYEVLADPVRRPKYDRRRSTYTKAVAARFTSSPKYASPALDPDDPRSAGATRGRFRVALATLMIVVVVLSAVNLVHYSTRLKEWLGASMSPEPTPERANPGRATSTPIVGPIGPASDDSPTTPSTAGTRNLPISQGAAAAVETAIPKSQPARPQGAVPAAANEKAAAKGSGVGARPSVGAPLRPAAAPASEPCREVVAALGLCSSNITAKNK